MIELDRKRAINEICKAALKDLSLSERESYILDWWGIDEDDVEFTMLPTDLQNRILAEDDIPVDYENSVYDDLILLALANKFIGITNTYLQDKISKIKNADFKVHGLEEVLHACPCCEFRTLQVRGNFEICRLCNWEDNGVNELDKYSGPNHKTLREGKKDFLCSAQTTSQTIQKFLRN